MYSEIASGEASCSTSTIAAGVEGETSASEAISIAGEGEGEVEREEEPLLGLESELDVKLERRDSMLLIAVTSGEERELHRSAFSELSDLERSSDPVQYKVVERRQAVEHPHSLHFHPFSSLSGGMARRQVLAVRLPERHRWPATIPMAPEESQQRSRAMTA